MATFEFDGEKYKKASRHQKEWGNRLISQLNLKGNETILDLGCGDGALTQQLSMLVPDGNVVGLDASVGMIQVARERKKDNLSFIHRDINEMEFESEFDVIFSNAALHWVKNHERLLKKSFTALKPGGVILWNFAGDGNCSSFFEVIQRKMQEPPYREFFCDFEWPWYMPSKAEYEKLIECVGFSRLNVKEENADRYFSSTDEMIKWIDQPSLVPFIQCVSDEKKDAFRSEVIEEMLQRTKQPDGTCFETFRRINVYAVK